MIRNRCAPGVLLLLYLFSASCSKNICPDYWQAPDCQTPSRNRFYGMYKGTSTLDNGDHTVTQWSMEAGPDISQLTMAYNLVLNLNAKDTRVFTVQDRAPMGNNLYIRAKGSSGFFLENTVTMEFWMDEGISVEPGEKLFHYSFTGTRK